ncbi:MAG: RNA polymerase sigma-70 factor [Bacteroidota bacterium]
MFLSKRKHKIDDPDFRTLAGFEIVYNLHWKTLYRLCRSYTNDPESSKELVQEIFESLWKNRNKLVIDKSIEHYLIKSAKLKAFQFLRNKTSRKEKLKTEFIEHRQEGNDTENQVNLNVLTQRVTSLVNLLPDQAKRVYVLSREKGLNNKEIAAKLCISPKTVENHLTKSLNFLRENLPEYKKMNSH